MVRNNHIMSLPREILIKIFKYLSPAERNNASETCCTWYCTANDYSFVKYKTIIYNTSNNINPLPILLNSEISFCNYTLKLQTISDVIDDFWVQLGINIRSLTIRNCDLNKADIDKILQSCKNLENLEFSCNLMSEEINRLDESEVTYELPNLKSMDLAYSRLSDRIFNTLVRHAPAIEMLNLTNCSMQYESDISDESNNYTNGSCRPSESESYSDTEFTFRYVMNFIKTRSKKIKYLGLSDANEAALHSITECRDLILESLKLDNIECSNANEEITNLLKKQSMLRKLQLSCSCWMSSNANMISDICTYLPNIVYLDLATFYSVTGREFEQILKLKKLEHLFIPFPILITLTEVMKLNFCKKDITNVLNLLHITNPMDIDEESIIIISENFPNLIYLSLGNCIAAITSDTLLSIFKFQKQLEVLDLRGCKKIRKLGRYYIDKDEPLQPDLSCLKRLKHLNLSNCYNITSESIERSLRLPLLMTLNISRCDITHENVVSIVRNCPNLMYLNVGFSPKITNETVVLIATSLKHLKQLAVHHCDLSMDDIIEYCSSLKDINSIKLIDYIRRILIMEETYKQYCKASRITTMYENFFFS